MVPTAHEYVMSFVRWIKLNFTEQGDIYMCPASSWLAESM